MFQKIKNNFNWILLAGLAAVGFFIWLAILEIPAPQDGIKIDFLDVGQGSAVLVIAPNGNQVLIDGGPSDAVLAKLGEALPVFDKKIELLILTHPDSDHLSGLIEVLKRYEVEKILETGVAENAAEYRAWNDLIAQKDIPVIFASAGQKIILADNFWMEILYPLGKINGQDFSKKSNAGSIVAKLRYGQISALFTGDAEINAEWMLQNNFNLKADILQVAHHGSKNSTSESFLAAVAPSWAVIQVGAKNRYGHPAPELLERLKNIQILRNDLAGDIEFECDLEKCERIEKTSF